MLRWRETVEKQGFRDQRSKIKDQRSESPMTSDGMDGRYLILEIQTTQPALLLEPCVGEFRQ